jgi:hypothetical protein
MVLPRRDDLASVNTEIDMLKRSKPPEGASEEAVRGYYNRINELEQKAKELSAKPDTSKPAKPLKLDPLDTKRVEAGLADRQAFPAQMFSLERKYKANPEFAALSTDEARAEWLQTKDPEGFRDAQTYDSSALESEINSARAAANRDDYINNSFDKSAKTKKLRGELYDYAIKYYSGGESPTTPKSDVDSYLDKF